MSLGSGVCRARRAALGRRHRERGHSAVQGDGERHGALSDHDRVAVALRPHRRSARQTRRLLGSQQLPRERRQVQGISCLPSVLRRCWLSGRKGIRPVKTEWWGAGVVICLERGADMHMAQLMSLPLTVSCFSKIQIGFTFLISAAHLVSP